MSSPRSTPSLSEIHAMMLTLSEQQTQILATLTAFDQRLSALERQVQQLPPPAASPTEMKSFTPSLSADELAAAALLLLNSHDDLETLRKKVHTYKEQGGSASQSVTLEEKQGTVLLLHHACATNPALAEALCEADNSCINLVDQHGKTPVDYTQEITLYKALLKHGAKVSLQHGKNILFHLARATVIDLDFTKELLIGAYKTQTQPLLDLREEKQTALDVLLSQERRKLNSISINKSLATAAVFYLSAGIPFQDKSFTYANFTERMYIASALFEFIIKPPCKINPYLERMMVYHAIDIAHKCSMHEPLTDQIHLIAGILNPNASDDTHVFLHQLFTREHWDKRCAISPQAQLNFLLSFKNDSKCLNDSACWPDPASVRKEPPENKEILAYLEKHFIQQLTEVLITACTQPDDESKAILEAEPTYLDAKFEISEEKFIGTALDYAFTKAHVPTSILLLQRNAAFSVSIPKIKDMAAALYEIFVLEYQGPQEVDDDNPRSNPYFRDKYTSLAELPPNLYLVFVCYKTELQDFIIERAMTLAKANKEKGNALLDFCLLGHECTALDTSRQSLACQLLGTPRDDRTRSKPKYAGFIFTPKSAAFKKLQGAKSTIAKIKNGNNEVELKAADSGLFSSLHLSSNNSRTASSNFSSSSTHTSANLSSS